MYNNVTKSYSMSFNIDNNVKLYKLMLKSHFDTGINYLCITKRSKYWSYLGSGKYWLNIVKSTPSLIITTLIYSSDDIKEFNEVCKQYSNLFDIPNNKDFANLIPECGYESVYSNFVDWRNNASVETLQEMYARSLKSRLSSGYKPASITKIRIGKANRIRWYNNLTQYLLENPEKSVDDFNIIKLQPAWNGYQSWRNSQTIEDKEAYGKKVSISLLKYNANLSDEDRIKLSIRNSTHRLNLSPEGKLKRSIEFAKNFIKDEFENYASKKVQANVEKMKVERISGGNPAAVPIVYKGVYYACKRDILKLNIVSPMMLEQSLLDDTISESYYVNDKKYREYEIGICPHCLKENQLTSAFKRWHFSNCKLKK